MVKYGSKCAAFCLNVSFVGLAVQCLFLIFWVRVLLEAVCQFLCEVTTDCDNFVRALFCLNASPVVEAVLQRSIMISLCNRDFTLCLNWTHKVRNDRAGALFCFMLLLCSRCAI